MQVAYFEDSRVDQFRPLAWLRPVFELVCGHSGVRERVNRFLNPTQWGAFLRPWLVEAYQEEHPVAHLNQREWLQAGPTLLLNGRWLPGLAQLPELASGEAAWIDGTLVALVIHPADVARLDLSDMAAGVEQLARSRREVPASGHLLHYPWDLVHHNGWQLHNDFRTRTHGPSKVTLGSQVAILGADEDVYIDPTAQIDPFVVVDARSGPVWIEAGVKVQPFTRIEGPCFIGQNSQLFRANVKARTTIGPVCRVGGEIEESIFHGYSNKYHDGFLGHSYIAPWVNLGALTTNSDLKNDYSAVSVPLWGESIGSGSTKVGCFIADHSKTALCSLFNTGSSVGVMSMILPGGRLLPKHIPSFSRIWHGAIEEIPEGLDPSLVAAQTAMSRRDCPFTPATERLLRKVYDLTAEERQRAIARAKKG
jgi:UDP-N-acetylglucosamine diphosphorylase / glucose-1-phosphate thymidylyltransferase / UDP-N-acetylgalactosamine diphosphorylase / glucosamine-1-phosphate N-acetyltransferase / galactosamine-1-phosphate N-acetyltransferase